MKSMKKLILLGFLACELAMPLNNFGMEFFNAFVEKFYQPIDTRRVGTGLGKFGGCPSYVIYDIAQKLHDKDVVHWMNTSSEFRSILQDELIKRWGLSWYWQVNNFTFVPLELILPDSIFYKKEGQKTVESIKFSPDGNYFVTAPDPILWKIKSNIVWKTEESDAGGVKFHKGYKEISAEIIKEFLAKPRWAVVDLQFSPNGQIIAGVYGDQIIFLWNGQTGEFINSNSVNNDRYVNGLVFSPNSESLAFGSSDLMAHDKAIEIWDLSKNKVKQIITIPNKCHPWLKAYFPDGNMLLAECLCEREEGCSAIELWGIKEKTKYILWCKCYTHYLTSMALSSDGTKLVAGFPSGEVLFWDLGGLVEKIKCCAEIKPTCLHKFDGHVRSVTVSPDGTIVAFASRDEIIMQEVSTRKIIQRLSGTGPLAFSPDGKMLAARFKNRIGLWQVVSEIHDQ